MKNQIPSAFRGAIATLGVSSVRNFNQENNKDRALQNRLYNESVLNIVRTNRTFLAMKGNERLYNFFKELLEDVCIKMDQVKDLSENVSTDHDSYEEIMYNYKVMKEIMEEMGSYTSSIASGLETIKRCSQDAFDHFNAYENYKEMKKHNTMYPERYY